MRYLSVMLAAVALVLRASAQVDTAKPEAFVLAGDVAGTHDPSIAEDHGTYYVFATGAVRPPRSERHDERLPLAELPQLPIRCSEDLHTWRRCGAVLPSIPAWIQQMSPGTQELWAPDISYFDGLYHLYYVFSIYGKKTSGIALLTNETLDSTSPNYKWEDRGLVLRSTVDDDFNAIDPNLVLDAKGNAWLAFGSYWSGVKMRKLDRKTGLFSRKDKRVYSLAARRDPRIGNFGVPPYSDAVEAAFVFQHDDCYYLFVSWDLCCRGVNSNYRTMVGRSKSVKGPYVDRDGKPMARGGGSPVLAGNATWVGPGGESLLHLPDEDLIVFHAYSALDGHPALQISTIVWRDGWPEAALEGDAR